MRKGQEARERAKPPLLSHSQAKDSAQRFLGPEEGGRRRGSGSRSEKPSSKWQPPPSLLARVTRIGSALQPRRRRSAVDRTTSAHGEERRKRKRARREFGKLQGGLDSQDRRATTPEGCTHVCRIQQTARSTQLQAFQAAVSTPPTSTPQLTQRGFWLGVAHRRWLLGVTQRPSSHHGLIVVRAYKARLLVS